MLKNAPLIVKIGVDTAENELQKGSKKPFGAYVTLHGPRPAGAVQLSVEVSINELN